MKPVRIILVVAAAVLASVVAAPAASASISPSMTLTQSATAAGTPANVSIDLSFSPSSGDSPKDLTVALAPGLLANAAIDGGACLSNTSTTPVTACQVGTGTVTAAGLGILPITGNLAFDLVAPPKPGDLAGVAAFLTLLGSTSELGSPADVTVRPAGSAAGVGLDMAFTNLPDTYDGLPITVDQLNTTFTGLRLPATCPATPARVTVTGDSYSDSTARSASAPLSVTACSALPYAPKFAVTATRDSGDSGVSVVTDITQKANEATSRTVALVLPSTVLTPNVAAVLTGGILCSDPTLASCKTIGSASSISPLYPKPLIGKAYLTGSLTAPAITLSFPAPFALTLNGSVDLATNTTTFHQLPDIPLTDLRVALTGGPDAAFASTCTASSGTATSTMTTQNGDRTVTVPAPFTVGNYSAATCTPPPGSGAGSSPGSGATAGRPSLKAASLTGLARRRPAIHFDLIAGSGAPKLSSFTVKLPRGLRFVRHRVHGRLRLQGVSLVGAKIKSARLSGGKLVVTLRKAAVAFEVKLSRKALGESAAVHRRARRRRIAALTMTAVVKDAAGKSTTLTHRFRRPH